MNHERISLPLIVLLLASLGGCSLGEGDAKDGSDGKPDAASREERINQMRERMQDRPVPVSVVSVSRGRVDAFYATTTSLTAEEEAVVVARTQGVVETIRVEEGDQVLAGDVLAQLDTRRLRLEVARTETNIDSFDQAFRRAKQLFEAKMISPDAYDEARFALEREKKALALQQYELNEATLRAPIDGIITQRLIKVGNTLSPNNPAFEIKNSARIEAILNVPERELAKLEEGQLARVRIDALGSALFDGLVKRIAPEIDPQSGTFRVTIQVANEQNRLKPGMFARVSIRYDSNDDTLLVARDALITQQDESAVFVVRDGVATRQPVDVGYASGSDVEILDGLGEGDQVVVAGQRGLRDGATVRIVRL